MGSVASQYHDEFGLLQVSMDISGHERSQRRAGKASYISWPSPVSAESERDASR